MAAVATAPGSATGAVLVGVEPRTARPVLWWAGLGAVFAGVMAYSFFGWVADGHATPTPPGPTPIPDWVRLTGYVQQAGGALAALTTLYLVVVRPWRKEGALTWDGMLVLACAPLFWHDPMANYFQPVITYNAGLVNLGSWASNIPGWNSPNGHLFPVPIFITMPTYMCILIAEARLGCALMRKVRGRRPHLGLAGLTGVVAVAMAAQIVVLELFWIRMQVYSYAGGAGPFSLASGTSHQLPWWQFVIFPVTLTAFALLRFCRDDRGQCVAERGIERVGFGRRGRKATRLLALFGMVNAMYLGADAAYAFAGAHSGPWPDDIVKKSYMVDGLCGPGTSYACPGRDTPIHTRTSVHIDPNGELVKP